MKIKDGRITMLFNENGATLELRDSDSSIMFVEVKLSNKQVCQMLSRLCHTDCESMEVFHLDKVGKTMEHKTFEFRIPKVSYQEQEEIAIKTIKKVCPEGWEPDNYFKSRDSFFIKNGQEYARCIIKRWL